MASSLSLILSMFLVFFLLATANGGMDLSKKEDTERVARPREIEVEFEIPTKASVLPSEDLEVLKTLQVRDGESSNAKEEQNPKLDDENEMWVQVSTESVVWVLRRASSDSAPFAEINSGDGRRDCSHKPWFRELPHHETEPHADESFGKGGKDASLDVEKLGHVHGNWNKHNLVGGVRAFDKLDGEESGEEIQESEQNEEEEKQEAEEKQTQLSKDEKPEIVRTENASKEEDIKAEPSEKLEKERTHELAPELLSFEQ